MNGKFYIGCHKTTHLDDQYMGSSPILKKAILKYGIENFQKEIVEFANDHSSLLLREKEILGEQYLLSDCYNLKPGGKGGSVKGRKCTLETKRKCQNWKRQ